MKKSFLTLLAVATLSLSALGQTNTPPATDTFAGTVSGLFNLNDTNSLVNAKELSALPVFKWDAKADRPGGGVKIDWFITDQQGFSLSYVAYDNDNKHWQTAYKTRTVFGKIEVGLEAGTQQNSADPFGAVVLYTAPSLTYRLRETSKTDIRLTIGADVTPDSTNPWFGIVFRFNR